MADKDRPDARRHSTDAADTDQVVRLAMTGSSRLETEKEIAKSDLAGAQASPDIPIPGVELQDQTNFLPLKQLLIVFAGLSMAMGCSMLDQSS